MDGRPFGGHLHGRGGGGGGGWFGDVVDFGHVTRHQDADDGWVEGRVAVYAMQSCGANIESSAGVNMFLSCFHV